MSGDELDRTIEFLLKNAARSEARFGAMHEKHVRDFERMSKEAERRHDANMQEHARFAQEQAAFQSQLTTLGENVAVMTDTLTRTLTAMNERDVRQDKRIARVSRQVAELAGLMRAHVLDPRAHGPVAK